MTEIIKNIPMFISIKQIREVLSDFSAIEMNLIPNTSDYYVHFVKQKILENKITLKTNNSSAENTILKLSGAYSIRSKSMPLTTIPNILKRLQWLEHVLGVSFPFDMKTMINDWESIHKLIELNLRLDSFNYDSLQAVIPGGLCLSDEELDNLKSDSGSLLNLMAFVKFKNNLYSHKGNEVCNYLLKFNRQAQSNVNHIGYEIFDFCSWHFTCFPAYKTEESLLISQPQLKSLSLKHKLPPKAIYFLFAQHKLFLWEGLKSGTLFNKKRAEIGNHVRDGIKKIQYHLDRVNLTTTHQAGAFGHEVDSVEESMYHEMLNLNHISFFGEVFPFDSDRTPDVIERMVEQLIENERIILVNN